MTDYWDEDACEEVNCVNNGAEACADCDGWYCLAHLNLHFHPTKPTVYLCEECARARKT